MIISVYYLKDEHMPGLTRPVDQYQASWYRHIYTYAEDPLEVTLEKVFRDWNVVDGTAREKPLTLKCRSMSIGDLVILDDGGLREGFICGSLGWHEVDEEYLRTLSRQADHSQP